MAELRVPFNKPCIVGTELEKLKDLIMHGGQFSGCGQLTEECEDQLSTIFESSTLLCTSATHALEMAAILLDFKDGEDVIIPSYTFVSTANAFVRAGAKVRFVDNDEFGNLSLESLKRVITPKTRAVVVVHYSGNSANMDKVVDFCHEKKITIIEDAAQSIGAKFRGKALGSFGALGCVSFHDTKNINCGEGGALIVNDPSYLSRAEIIREKGTNRKQFMQGLVDKYSWVDIGSSFVVSELNAAFLLAQLESLKNVQARREVIWKEYYNGLKDPMAKRGIQALEIPPHNTPNYHMFALKMKTVEQRNDFIAYMKERLIGCAFHYVALHTSPFGRKLLEEAGQSESEFKNSKEFTECLVRLPLYYNLSAEDQEYVMDTALGWLKQQ